MKKVYSKKDMNDALIYYDRMNKHLHEGESMLVLCAFAVGAFLTMFVIIIKEMMYASHYC